nr:uncharacterized protein LOC109422658 [Aedes albopictus]
MYANGYKYWLAYRKGHSGYYRCARYKVNCPGRCMVSDDGSTQTSTPHNHPPETDRVAVERFRKVLTRRAATEGTDLHEIYLEEATRNGGHADAALLYTFAQAVSCMRKARRKLLPMEPSGMDELGDILEGSDLFRIHCGNSRDAFYQRTVRAEEEMALVLWHKRTLDAVGRIDTLFLDSSLVVCGSGSSKYHVLMGVIAWQEKCVPVIYSVMSVKTSAIFARIFSYIREQLQTITLILTEPCSVIHNALAMHFPEATIKVYWFHYVTAVLDRHHGISMGAGTADGFTNSALRMLLVLPLLPAEHMNRAFEVLKSWMDRKHILSANLRNLCDYIHSHWLTTVGSERLSLFDHTRGTTSTPNDFLQKFRDENDFQKQSLWQLLETWTQLATKQYVILNKHIRKMKSSSKSYRTKSKAHLVQEEAIRKAKELWKEMPENGKDPLQFLQACSHCISNDVLTKRPSKGSSETEMCKPSIPSERTIVDQPGSQTDSQHLTPLDTVNTSQSQKSEITPSREVEPPPLVFFPKLRQVESSGITTGMFQNQTEPPPLVPFRIENHSLSQIPFSTS